MRLLQAAPGPAREAGPSPAPGLRLRVPGGRGVRSAAGRGGAGRVPAGPPGSKRGLESESGPAVRLGRDEGSSRGPRPGSGRSRRAGPGPASEGASGQRRRHAPQLAAGRAAGLPY